MNILAVLAGQVIPVSMALISMGLFPCSILWLVISSDSEKSRFLTFVRNDFRYLTAGFGVAHLLPEMFKRFSPEIDFFLIKKIRNFFFLFHCSKLKERNFKFTFKVLKNFLRNFRRGKNKLSIRKFSSYTQAHKTNIPNS